MIDPPEHETHQTPLEAAQVKAAASLECVLRVSEALEARQEGKITGEEVHEVMRTNYKDARIARMGAVMLALSASKNRTGGPEHNYTEGLPAERLAHASLQEHYKLGDLALALAQQKISVEEFATVCALAEQGFKDYFGALQRDRNNLPKHTKSPEKLAQYQRSGDLAAEETQAVISELQTYQQASAATLARGQAKI